jgi:LDH2 family malate/lactate/ureidoglycolate dehydrogenase
MSGGSLLVGEPELAALVRGCFEELGLRGDDAEAVADVLVYANLRGIDSHGFIRLPIYMSRVASGLAGGTERMSVTAEFGALCRLDAGGALGPAAGIRGVDRAIALAGQHGVGVVAVGGSTHFGVAGYYAERAAEQGLLSIVCTNAPKTMVPFGGRDAFLGTNPLAVAAPLGRHGAFVLDMSSSVVARGKIMRAAGAGAPIEPGLAVDADGAPTTDSQAALDGSLMPLGGPKGSGLAMAIDILLVALAGADFGGEMASMYEDRDRRQNVGHLFIVIDPARVGDPGVTAAVLNRLVDSLRAVRPADGFDGISFAGEREAALARRRAAEGIPIRRVEVQELLTVLDQHGLRRSLARAQALLDTTDVSTQEGAPT